MNRMLRAFALVALFIGAGTFLSFWGPENATFAAFSDPEAGEGRFVAQFSVGGSCVLWANRTGNTHVLQLSGNSHTFGGCVHSNSDVKLTGGDGVFHRTIRYNSTFSSNANGHQFMAGAVRVPREDYPVRYVITDYAPTGSRAVAAGGKYHFYSGNVALDSATLGEGLHYVQGDVTVDVDGVQGRRVSIVATGKVTFAGQDGRIEAYMDGLLGYANAVGSGAMKLGAKDSVLVGRLFAPRGEAHASANNMTVSGAVMADTIHVSSHGARFLSAQLAAPPNTALARSSSQASLILPISSAPQVPKLETSTVEPALDLPIVAYVGIGDMNSDGGFDILIGLDGTRLIIPGPIILALLP